MARLEHVRWIAETREHAIEGVSEVIRERCTCTDRDPALPPLERHEAGCSLQNTGWLS